MTQPSSIDEDTARQLIAAVEVALNPSPTINQTDRSNANHFCSRFKETCANCAPYGLYLAQKQNAFHVRHVGLQLFEHSIKHQWNVLGPPAKLFIKDSAMKLLAEGTNDLLREPPHIKDALSRLIVEMIKREWPQQWRDMLEEMKQLAALGETQTELVLFILLRLAEDVVCFQNLPNQRRRDIQQALVQNMDFIFAFLVDILRESVSRYMALRNEDPVADKCKAFGKVASSALLALSGFVDWVNVDHLVNRDAVLIKMLCELLSDPLLRQEAVEVLLLIVGRKGKVTERAPLVTFIFRADSMRAILGAATVTAQPTDEKNFLFLKRLCQVLTAIGSQIHALWGSSDLDSSCPMPPDNFAVFLMALVEFSLHDSQVLNNLTMPLWSCFLGNDHVVKDANFAPHLKSLVEGLPAKLIKVGYPSANDSPSCSYSKMDFDSDEDFYSFFVKFRADVSTVIRSATKFLASELVDIAGKWLLKLLSQVGVGTRNPVDELHWDACAILLDSVLGRCDLSDTTIRNKGSTLMRELLKVQTSDPVTYSFMLSCVSALFSCLTFEGVEDPTFLAALERIFGAVIFDNDPGQNKATRSRACKNLRRHACSSLVTICKKNAVFLLPKFQQLHQHIIDLDKNGNLSQMEKVTLYEALLLIANRFEDFDKQSVFIQGILAPIGDIWSSERMNQALDQSNGPFNFMSHVGLDQPALEPSVDDVCGIHRSNLILCLNMIKGVVGRSAILNPASLDVDQLATAKRRRFVVDCPSQPRGVIAVNPATAHVTVYLKNLCLLVKTHHSMWTPAALSKVHPDYSNTLFLSDIDKRQYIGIVAENNKPASEISTMEPIGSPKNPQERLRQFFVTVYDTTCQILGSCGAALGPQYYFLDGFSSFIVESVFHNFENVPDYRLRLLNRGFLKPFFQNLPIGASAIEVALPILAALCPAMQGRLTPKWEAINKQVVDVGEAEAGDSQDATNDEVVEEAILRVFTREYFDLLICICISRNPGSSSAQQNEATIDDEAEGGTKPPSVDAASPVSELGKAVCKMEQICTPVLCLAFKALSWRDTSTCNKCVSLCLPLLKEVVSHHGTLPGEVVEEFFTDILRGLRENGQHDACQSNLLTLGAQFYDAFGVQHSGNLKAVLVQIPNTTLKEVETFHSRFFPAAGAKPTPEKKKRDLFKNVVEKVIGKHLGQQFKSDVKIKNLPPIFKPKIARKPLTEASPDEVGLVGLFAPTD